MENLEKELQRISFLLLKKLYREYVGKSSIPVSEEQFVKKLNTEFEEIYNKKNVILKQKVSLEKSKLNKKRS